MEIRDTVRLYGDRLRELRRALHTFPECACEERRTSAYLYDSLQKLQPDSLMRLADTGVKAVFLAENAQKTIAIRADIDALPIREESGCAFASENDGAMHACGHDGHMAMALVTAEMVSKARGSLRHNYVFLFQPSEESLGGARRMIGEGALKKPDVDEIYGLHLWPGLDGGVIGLRPGSLMAGMRDLNIELTGRPGHGARPQEGTDALVAAAQLISGVHTIISRNLDPQKGGVITIGKIEGGNARNIICDFVKLEGTMRAFDGETEELLKHRVGELLDGLQTSYGVTYKSYETMRFPPVINDTGLAEYAMQRLEGDYTVPGATMVSEDFSEFQKEIPGLFAFLGIRDARWDVPLHSSRFNFDEEWLQYGVEYFLRVMDF